MGVEQEKDEKKNVCSGIHTHEDFNNRLKGYRGGGGKKGSREVVLL